jgi:hypothetical protein
VKTRSGVMLAAAMASRSSALVRLSDQHLETGSSRQLHRETAGQNEDSGQFSPFSDISSTPVGYGHQPRSRAMLLAFPSALSPMKSMASSARPSRSKRGEDVAELVSAIQRHIFSRFRFRCSVSLSALSPLSLKDLEQPQTGGQHAGRGDRLWIGCGG